MAPVASDLTDFQSGYATWAPHHTALAYGNAGVAVVDPATGKSRWLVRGQSLSMPAWSPDGKQIAYGDGLIMLTSPAARARPDRILNDPNLAPFGFDWSPRGVIAFQGLRLNCQYAEGCFSTNRSDIWTVRPNGAGLTQLTHVGQATNPKWSPDGSRALFVRTVHRGKAQRSELWEVNSNGNGLRQLSSAGNVLAADWSPAGDQLIIVRQGVVANTLELWVANADGSKLHPIDTGIAGSDATVDW